MKKINKDMIKGCSTLTVLVIMCGLVAFKIRAFYGV